MARSRFNSAGQGALEYLLLIGGAVLVTVLVLVMIFGGIFPGVGNITSDNINNFTTTVSLNSAFGGGGGPVCVVDGSCVSPENNSNCPLDCPGAACNGNNVCDGTETAATCIADCHCGDSICQAGAPYNETTSSCAADCPAAPVCGDGIVSEACDDGATVGGDGCSPTCTIEPGYSCSGAPSTCTLSPVCGDGVVNGTDSCDDGGTTGGDGCDATCQVESGYSCSGTPSTCTLSAILLSITNPTTPDLSTAGKAGYSFTWTGAYPPGYGSQFTGLVVLPSAATTPISSVTQDGTINFTSPFGTLNTASPGGTSGFLTNYGIKDIQLNVLLGSPGVIALAANQDTPTFDNANFYLISDTLATGSIPWPADIDVPALSTVTSSAIATNGGEISYDFTQVPDRYLGTSVIDAASASMAFRQYSYQVGYCPASSAACTPAIPVFTDPAVIVDSAPVTFPVAKVSISTFTTPILGTANWSKGIIPSKDYYVLVKMCDFFDNCHVNKSPLVTASKEAKLFEAEIALTSPNVLGAGLVQGGTSPLFLNVGGLCDATNNFAQYSITLNAPASTPTTYYPWMYIRNTAFAAQTATLGIGSSVSTFNSNPGAFTWVQGTTTISSNGNTQTLELRIPCSSNGLRVDKILITTQDPGAGTGQCTPTGDGSNCQ